MKKYNIEIYRSKNGKEIFTEWMDSIKDKNTTIKIMRRIRRLELGNFGDYKFLGFGLYELRLFFGSGYRVYYTMKGNRIVVLLCGGDKSSQGKDVNKAKKLLEEMS